MQQSDIIEKLLVNRGLITKNDQDTFFNPPPPTSFASPFDSTGAIQLIKLHISRGNQIAIYGDYDVDGICSTAILWETLHNFSDLVFPHIPHRREEGYGLSQKGIDHCLEKNAKLIIAVDNGIVAFDQVDYCRAQGCDIIIIDHHEPANTQPNANVILHSTQTCAAVLAWLFCRDFTDTANLEHIGLAALAVICDMVPLLGINRSFAAHGLKQLRTTSRPGLVSLCEEAGFTPDTIDTYKVGFLLGPRLNAMGRLEHAVDSLRLLCTTSSSRAKELAHVLSETNKSRQEFTASAVDHALTQTRADTSLLVAADASYDEGIIGLVASKLVEKFYRPTLVISIGEEKSKGSARSISGFDITDHLRKFQSILTAVGGHAMAAGFSLPTARLGEFVAAVTDLTIAPEILVKKQRIDCEIPLSVISRDFITQLEAFAPFGLGNPQPVFQTTPITISNTRRIGQEGKHLKFVVDDLDGIYFNAPLDLVSTSISTLIYSVGLNTFNGRTTVQLVVKNSL